MVDMENDRKTNKSDHLPKSETPLWSIEQVIIKHHLQSLIFWCLVLLSVFVLIYASRHDIRDCITCEATAKRLTKCMKLLNDLADDLMDNEYCTQRAVGVIKEEEGQIICVININLNSRPISYPIHFNMSIYIQNQQETCNKTN